jgi:TatD DNase family protein
MTNRPCLTREQRPAPDAGSFYEHAGSLYVNLTNRCPVACRFCAKQAWDWNFRGHDLLLKTEAPIAELRAGLRERLSAPRPWHEIVFCGYGESTYRLAEMSRLGRDLIGLRPEIPVRLNTIGLGDMIWGRDIVPELARFLGSVSVSLNTVDPEQWVELHRPASLFRAGGFAAACRFAERSVAAGLRTRVTAVELPGVDLEAVRAYALLIGAEFLVRPQLVDQTPE